MAVVGAVGSGKSTFARTLSKRTGLPLLVLDDLYWRDGPVPSDDEWVRKHDALVSMNRWVIDGDYRAVARARFARADTVIWIDPPLVRRWSNIVHRARHDHPAPVWDCLRWTTRYSVRGSRETASALAAAPPSLVVHRVKTRRAQRALLAHLAVSGAHHT